MLSKWQITHLVDSTLTKRFFLTCKILKNLYKRIFKSNTNIANLISLITGHIESRYMFAQCVKGTCGTLIRNLMSKEQRPKIKKIKTTYESTFCDQISINLVLFLCF